MNLSESSAYPRIVCGDTLETTRKRRGVKGSFELNRGCAVYATPGRVKGGECVVVFEGSFGSFISDLHFNFPKQLSVDRDARTAVRCGFRGLNDAQERV